MNDTSAERKGRAGGISAGDFAAVLRLAELGNAVKDFRATWLASTWLFAPRKCAHSRSERPRAAKTRPKNA
jgi:hypothetical protein